MRIIETLEDIKQNMSVLDGYIGSRTDPEYSFALDLIKRGTCFIAVEHNNSYRFYPSRFMGYANNSMDAHLNNDMKDGRETNPAISKILESTPLSIDMEMEKAYRKYCEKLGFTANEKGAFGVERKYWRLF